MVCGEAGHPTPRPYICHLRIEADCAQSGAVCGELDKSEATREHGQRTGEQSVSCVSLWVMVVEDVVPSFVLDMRHMPECSLGRQGSRVAVVHTRPKGRASQDVYQRESIAGRAFGSARNLMCGRLIVAT